jgi:RNA polymerase sigma-70 factor (ECF subfamily)
MKTESLEFNRQLFTFKDTLRHFAISFTKNEDDADDLVQETFLKAIRYAAKFEQGTNLKSWLYMILKNTFINNYRRANKLKFYKAESAGLAADNYENNAAGNKGESKCALDDIQGALAKLPYEYYYPFIKYFEGYKYHEIAAELNIPIGTVKTRIHCARLVLKKNLKMYHAEFLKN